MENLHTEIVEIIGNDWLLRKYRGNLQRMDRANALDLMLRDLETIARDSGSSSSAARVLTV
jgi:UDP-N-acetylglucosamine--N-acetylmuramyl-(pentapeptide) pyrophosphoryl-undecaprenol N-acetylglucosamine transferase